MLDYLCRHFPKHKLVGYNSLEFTTDSFFAVDNSKHLSINTMNGLWQCFKSKQKGNFVQLVAKFEGTSYAQAESTLARTYLNNLEYIESQLIDFEIEDEVKEFTVNSLLIDKYGTSLNETSNFLLRRKAIDFLTTRKLLHLKDSVFIGDVPKTPYFGRLIIPFEVSGNIFYFQARTLHKDPIKYLNPPSEEVGVKSGQVLYPFNYEKDYVFVTEGPLDSATLQHLGVNSTSIQGSAMSPMQLSQLKKLRLNKVILSLDTDEAGRVAEGMLKSKLLKKGFAAEQVYRCIPPSGFKDWNEMYCTLGKKVTQEHILGNIAVIDELEDLGVELLND